MRRIKYIIVIFIMASIPMSIFAINLNSFESLLTNFNNTKVVLETAKIFSQLNFKDSSSKEIIKKFKLNNKKRYQDEIMTFSRSDKRLNDAYNLIQAYYYLYGKDYWYKVMVNRISNKLILSKVEDQLLKSVFINENFDLLIKNLDYVSKKMYEYDDIISSLLTMYKWKVQEIYNSMQDSLKNKKYDNFIENYKILKALDKYPKIKSSIGVYFTLPVLEYTDFNNTSPEATTIFKYFPKLFKDVYEKNLSKAKEDFQKGMYTDTIKILNYLINITNSASNTISEDQKTELQNMLVKTKSVKNFILGISNIYLKIQRANSWNDFSSILDEIYSDFDNSYIVYFDHAFINGKLSIIFRDYKKSLSDYIKIKNGNGEKIVGNMTSLYNKSELIKSKIKYNDILKDRFNDLSAYLKQFIREDAKKESKKEAVMVSSISISMLVGVLIFLWIFLSPVSKANLFMMLGMKKTALSIMQKHIAQEAENPQFHLTLGEIYEKIGRNKEAEYHYKIAMEYFKKQNKEGK